MTIEQKIQYLTKKLNNPKARYTDEELSWLINHIGDPDAKIRDELVCNTFGSGFFEEKFTREQVRFLFENVQKSADIVAKSGNELLNSLRFNEVDWTIVVKRVC